LNQTSNKTCASTQKAIEIKNRKKFTQEVLNLLEASRAVSPLLTPQKWEKKDAPLSH
jgi:hypothetical protein